MRLTGHEAHDLESNYNDKYIVTMEEFYNPYPYASVEIHNRHSYETKASSCLTSFTCDIDNVDQEIEKQIDVIEG